MPISIKKTTDDKALFFPQWDCFCCHDTGIVPDYLVRTLPGYELYSCQDHKNVLCTCIASSRFSEIRDAFDNSLTHQQQEYLHHYVRQDWINTNKAIANGDKTRANLLDDVSTFAASF